MKTPHRPRMRFGSLVSFRCGICRRRHPHRHRPTEADWAVMRSSCVTMWREAEHWHVRHLMLAMVGDDDAVGNGGTGAKERRELGVVSRSSTDTPDHRENALQTSAWHRAPAAMRVGCRCVNLGRLNAERVKWLTLSRNDRSGSSVPTIGAWGGLIWIV